MPRISASKELSRDELANGTIVVCRLTVDMPFPYSDLTSVTRAVHAVKDGTWSRRWVLVSGDYKINRGSWVLRRFHGDPNRTYAVYRAQVLPTSWVPGWMRS